LKIIAFAASNSRNSINARLVRYACTLVADAAKDTIDIEIIDINDYEMPLYSIDIEEESGVPEAAGSFLKKLAGADALIISFAEHNGLYTAAYKSLFDWASRVDRHVYQHKPIVMLATSPGGRGGSNVLDIATAAAPRFGGTVLAAVSIPKFYENFDFEKNQLSNPEQIQMLKAALVTLSGPDVVIENSAET
jgi:NAD(P)H-dependent FMN reductase